MIARFQEYGGRRLGGDWRKDRAGGYPPTIYPYGDSRDFPRGQEEAPQGPIGVRGLVGPGHWGRWKISRANQWRQGAHINVLECYAEALGVEWVLRKGSPLQARRICFLQDSQVVVFAGTKGRSSSLGLMRPLRRTAALLIAGNLSVDRLWIPSKSMPADGPSRGRPIGDFD